MEHNGAVMTIEMKATTQDAAYLAGCMEAYPEKIREVIKKYADSDDDVALSDFYTNKRANCRLMIAGKNLREGNSRLQCMPLFFEKIPGDAASDDERDSDSLHEQFVTESIARDTMGLAPMPLGASNGVYRAEWVNGKTLGALSPLPRRELTIVDMVNGKEQVPSKEAMSDYWQHLEKAQAALDGLHDAGYSHGDAHLGNFMIEANGNRFTFHNQS